MKKTSTSTSTPKRNDVRELQGETVKIVIREWTDGKRTVEFATLTICEEITIYNCTVRTTKEGKRFLSLPQFKGSDGNYYNVVFIAKDSDTANEIDELLNMETV